MDSEAYLILKDYETKLNADKSLIQTVTTKYMSLDKIRDDMRANPGDYPKVSCSIGGIEIPDTAQTVGKAMRYLLPIIADLYVKESSDIQLEASRALKELRDITEKEDNTYFTPNNHSIVLPFTNVQRLITYTATDPLELIIGLSSINFNVRYAYTRGDS